VSRLRREFITWVRAMGYTEFRTRDVVWWYQQNKKTPQTPADYTNMYRLILHPLEASGHIRRVTHGIYRLVEGLPEPDDHTPAVAEEEDEFLRYVAEKTKQKREVSHNGEG